ncbi:TssQ family T6SS-associated lipoprotein [Burkholderia arboris]|nr:TssQ family T6SS-associated lipoprotein [Burkholderia arboris]MCA8495578.1 TssQ family T6SS-associated lipoprotein [Burkholderia arboris]UTV57478.1 TssQ family T6SS-associated lipoprotein [Burkholderia arboris]
MKQNVTATSASMIGTRIQQRLCALFQLREFLISIMKGRASIVVFLGAWLLGAGGCSTSPTQSAAHATVDSARAAYAAGDYGRTIALLSHAKEIDGADTDTQVAAHKLLAFSYCVTNRIAPCRAEFSKILDLNPRFDLSPAEKGHPIWGPAFEFARRRHASTS